MCTVLFSVWRYVWFHLGVYLGVGLLSHRAGTVHGVTKSQTLLSDFTFTFHFHTLEKKMATHSSVLAWRIPGTGEPSGLPSMGSHRVGHDWSDLASVFIKPFNFRFSSFYWSVYWLGLLWYWMVCLGNEQRSFCHFWDCSQVQTCRLWWLLHFF